MIRDSSGNKITAKQKARDVLLDAMSVAFYRLNDDDSLTPREREQVEAFMLKEGDRVARLLGYESMWWG